MFLTPADLETGSGVANDLSLPLSGSCRSVTEGRRFNRSTCVTYCSVFTPVRRVDPIISTTLSSPHNLAKLRRWEFSHLLRVSDELKLLGMGRGKDH